MVDKIDKVLLKLTIEAMKKSLSKIDDNLKEFESYMNTPNVKQTNIIVNYIEKSKSLDNVIVKLFYSLRESGVDEGYVNLISTQVLSDNHLVYSSDDINTFHRKILNIINELIERNLDILEILKVIVRKYNGRKDV